MHKPFLLSLLFLLPDLGHSQTVFHTADIPHFYEAFDAVLLSDTKEKQVYLVQTLYLDRGSEGIKYVIRMNEAYGRSATAEDWLTLMLQQEAYFKKIRPYFSSLDKQKEQLQRHFVRYKNLYPAFKDGNVYFFMGLGIFGGRPEGNNLYMACELLATEREDWAVNMVLHEFTHTFQEVAPDRPLLAQSIHEGSCEFIAELISGQSIAEQLPSGYMAFGEKNDAALWNDFKKYIPSNENGRYFSWLYGQNTRTINGESQKDLGYYMGYAICKSYYTNTPDKKQAIKDIIELNTRDHESVRKFLLKSGYVPEQDQSYVSTFNFGVLSEVSTLLNFQQMGYEIKGETVVFHFDVPEGIKAEKVNIAGSFNGWNPQDPAYLMSLQADGSYTFKLPIASLKEKQNEFKFVVNGQQWQDVPELAKNARNGNFSLDL